MTIKIWKSDTGAKKVLPKFAVKEVEVIDFDLKKAAETFVKSAKIVSLKEAAQIAYACGLSRTRMWTVD